MKLRFIDKSDFNMKEILRGASVAFVLKVIGGGLGFMFNVLLARLLGPEGTGIYFLALTVTTIATVFGRLGLDNALLRFTAANAGVGDWSAVKGVYEKGMTLALVASGTAAVVMFAAARLLAERVFSKPELTAPMRWMALAVVPVAFLTLNGEALKGLKRIRDSQLVQGVGVPALSLIGLRWLGQVWGVNGAIWAYTWAAVLTALMGYMMWRMATPQLRNSIGHFETRQLLRSSVPLFWVASMNLLMGCTASFLLGIWGTNAEVGIFGVAYRTAMVTGYILIAVNSIAAPKFASLYKQGDMAALGSVARNSAKLMTLAASPILLLFVLFPGWVMRLFGPQFVEGAAVLIILALGQFVNVATGSVGYLLMMSGHERLMRNNIVCIAILNVVMCLLLIPWAGAIGAAIATAISLSAMNLVSVVLVYSRLSILTLPIPKGIFARRA
jgi:O-antigen/teichoic acid export membrane protein